VYLAYFVHAALNGHRRISRCRIAEAALHAIAACVKAGGDGSLPEAYARALEHVLSLHDEQLATILSHRIAGADEQLNTSLANRRVVVDAARRGRHLNRPIPAAHVGPCRDIQGALARHRHLHNFSGIRTFPAWRGHCLVRPRELAVASCTAFPKRSPQGAMRLVAIGRTQVVGPPSRSDRTSPRSAPT
jgi:hypothetical protein